jgi:arginine decarboxylase
LGSQIANIYDINKSMKEVARYYVELHALQAPICKIDVGGGLGVDYHGTQSNMDCSINYSVKEYATHILSAIRDLCEKAQLPEPDIISESGRALTAHHAVLITNITDVEVPKKTHIDPNIDLNDSKIARNIFDTYQTMKSSPLTKIYHYAEHALNEIYSMFKHGELSLTEKSKVEQIYNNICIEIQQKLDDRNPADAELLEILNQRFAAKIFCNLSFFQSIPDAWAIGQIFPIVPISQLDKKPLMHCLLQDLTCDSDGTIKQYTGKTAVNSTLLLPSFDPNNPYNIGFFLVGAYQEILGNLHNLFGDTNSMDVKLKDDGQFEINDLVSGDTIANVLNYAHFDTKKLLRSYEEQLNNTDLCQETIQSYLNELRSIFTQSTYLKGKIT